MSKRLQGILIGVVVGVFIAGGVAYAVTVVPPNESDRYYACVGGGVVRPATLRLNTPPSNCPKATDTIRSWNAQGPMGPQGPQGPAGPGAALRTLRLRSYGGGKITIEGLSCFGDQNSAVGCVVVLPAGTPISNAVAEVQPTNGQTFEGWLFSPCTGKGACSFTLNEDTTLLALFSTVRAAVSIQEAGSGQATFTTTISTEGLAGVTDASVDISPSLLYSTCGYPTDFVKASLVPGTVATTAGTATTSTVNGLDAIHVSIGSIAPNSQVTITFQANNPSWPPPFPDPIWSESGSLSYSSGQSITFTGSNRGPLLGC